MPARLLSLGRAAGAGVPLRLTVTPNTVESTGAAHVEGFLHDTGGSLVRQFGRVTMRVRTPSVLDVEPGGPRARALALWPGRPNPFSGSTTIRYALLHAGPVKLQVFDLAGRLVRTLVAGAEAPGTHEAAWDGRADGGERLAAGLYFLRLEMVGQDVATGKVLRLR